jgi:histidinol-phosphate aminotransferase
VITPVHGGPDGQQAILHDFSTNASPLGPPPELARALACADRTCYPDPSYGALRARLAAWHGVAPQRILPTAGTSEAIRRLTLAARLQGVTTVWAPRPGYGDYAAAAAGLDLALREYRDEAQLLDALAAHTAPVLAWICEPCNPTGRSLAQGFWSRLHRAVSAAGHVIGLDRAYESLRLVGVDPVPDAAASRTWQCFSPNKALGLTGIRAGYLVAPDEDPQRIRVRAEALAPSWVLSAEGVALLGALHAPSTRAWLATARATLSRWDAMQRAGLAGLGWEQRPSVVPFWLARPPDATTLPHRLRQLRAVGIKLRDATSLGLPGWVRVSAQPPASQHALCEAWGAIF